MFSKDRVKYLPVAEESSAADLVAMGIEQHSFKVLLAPRDTKAAGLRLTVGAKSDYVKLFKNCFEQQKMLIKRKIAVLERFPTENEA